MSQLLTRLAKFARLSARREFRRGLRLGVGASIEHLAVVRSLALNTVVDIGANVGQFTLLVTGVHPRVIVHAFEPLPEPAATFRKLFKGMSSVTLHEVAIGPHATTVLINVSRRQDSSSILPISRLQTESFPGTEKVATVSVRVSPLDAAMKVEDVLKPALLKLDVQGYEMEALRGCERMLHLFNFVFAELSFVELYEGQALAHEVIDFLRAKGFEINGVHNAQYDAAGRSIQCDCLFVRERS